MASNMVAKEKIFFFKIYESHSIPVMIYSNFCRFCNEMRLFLRNEVSMENKLNYAVFLVILWFLNVIFKGTQ